MHIPDGFMNAPTALATAGVSLGVVAYASRRIGRELGERTVPLLGVTAAFIFAAQMLNFPVGAGTSGHFLGATFAAIVMGPWAAAVVMTVVVAVQAVGMADGGITALGANVMNMGVVGVLAGYLAHRALRALLPATTTWYLAGVAAAAWFSVVAASAATAIELGASGTVPLRMVLPAMTSVHMIIGIGEALITTTVLGTILASRPDLVKNGPRSDRHAAHDPSGPHSEWDNRPASAGRTGRTWAFVATALVVAAALVVLVAPFASSAPDGLERVAQDQGFAGGAAAWRLSPIPGYSFPGFADTRPATAAAGLAGILVMFALILGLGRALGGRRGAPPPLGTPAGAIHPLGGHEHTDHRHSGHSHRGHGHATHVPEDADPDHIHGRAGGPACTNHQEPTP